MDGKDQQPLLSRRHMLVTGALALTGAVLAPAAAARSRQPRARTSGWRRERFAPHVGARVELRPPGGRAVAGRLVAVEDLQGVAVRHLAGSPHAYALRLRAAQALPLAGGIVAVRHPGFGALRLFVSRSTGDGRAPEYVAIVNRTVPRGAAGPPRRAAQRQAALRNRSRSA